jgi:hypothetical protein
VKLVGDYPRGVDRIPYSAMLETREEHVHPPVRPIRFPIRTRWYIVQLKPWATWADVWRNLGYLVRGRS